MRSIRPRRAVPLVVLSMVALVLSACGSSDKSSSDTTKPVSNSTTAATTAASGTGGITFVAEDFSYVIPKDVPGGWQQVTLDNQGSEQHQLSVARLADGQDATTVEGQLDKDDLSFLAQATLVGAPDGVASGQKETVTTLLDPGRYIVFCAVPSPSDGKPHFQKGMRSSFTVTKVANQVAQPKTDGTISITPTGYEVPTGFTGKGTFAVTNAAKFGAEMGILRLAKDATQADVVTFLTGTPTGPPPFTAAGGVSAMAPGSKAYIDLDLDPGNYVFLSFAPDPSAGFKPQFTNGIISTVTVK